MDPLPVVTVRTHRGAPGTGRKKGDTQNLMSCFCIRFDKQNG